MSRCVSRVPAYRSAIGIARDARVPVHLGLCTVWSPCAETRVLGDAGARVYGLCLSRNLFRVAFAERALTPAFTHTCAARRSTTHDGRRAALTLTGPTCLKWRNLTIFQALHPPVTHDPPQRSHRHAARAADAAHGAARAVTAASGGGPPARPRVTRAARPRVTRAARPRVTRAARGHE